MLKIKYDTVDFLKWDIVAFLKNQNDHSHF